MYLGGETAAANVGLAPPKTAPASYGSGGGGGAVGITLMAAFRPPSASVGQRAATAPEMMSTDLVDKFRPPTIAEATIRQNRKLERALRTADGIVEGGGAGRSGWRRRVATARGLEDEGGVGFQFDKNLGEIMKLLDRAKSSDDRSGTTSLDSSPKKRKGGDIQQFGGTEQKHQQTLFDLVRAAEGKSLQLAGRKPMRLIAAELEKRVERLKTNQQEWEEFQGLIMEYKHAEAAQQPAEQIDAIRQNKLLLQYMYPEHKKQLMEQMKDTHEMHRQTVLDKKKRMDKAKREKWEAVLRRKDETAGQSLRKEKEEMGRAAMMQRKWFILTVVASRLGMFKHVLDDVRARRRVCAINNHAARVIQKAYRRYKRRQDDEKQRKALMQIAGVFKIYVHRRRQRAKHNASNCIRQFFKEVHDVSKLMKIVKKYRYSVVKAQGYVRNFHDIRNAQVVAIGKAWDRAEPEWWMHRKRGGGGGGAGAGMKKAMSREDVEEKKEKKGKKGKGKKKEDSVTTGMGLKVPENIKMSIILEDLIVRRKAHRVDLANFVDKLNAYNASKKKRLVVPTIHRMGEDAGKDKGADGDEADGGPPRRPIFKLIPPSQDLFALIEKGFLETTTSGK
ncbi:hypothetical protein HDV00_004133 [Rhizophlyctis rosea]|nr:hypothetical protein HDV00_004133 [Rhizophlyctis rosea]